MCVRTLRGVVGVHGRRTWIRRSGSAPGPVPLSDLTVYLCLYTVCGYWGRDYPTLGGVVPHRISRRSGVDGSLTAPVGLGYPFRAMRVVGSAPADVTA